MVVLEWSPFQASWDFKKSYYTHTMRGCPALELYSIHVNLCVAVATGVNPDLTLFLAFKNVFLHYSVMAVLVIYCTVLVNTQTRAHQQKFNICSRRNPCICTRIWGISQASTCTWKQNTSTFSCAWLCLRADIKYFKCMRELTAIYIQAKGRSDRLKDRSTGR